MIGPRPNHGRPARVLVALCGLSATVIGLIAVAIARAL